MSRHHSNHYSYEDEEYDYPQEDYNNEFYYQDQAGRPVVHNFSELYGRPDGGEIASPPPQIKKEHRRYKQSASIPPEYFYNQAVEEEERMQQKKYVKPKYQYFTVVTPEQYAYKQRVIKAFGQQEKQTNKRYPITVKTPRFFKRSTTSCTVYKQPSTLCLPVISQPDPATHRKSKRQEQQDAIPFEPSLLSKQHHLKIPQIEPHQIDSEGDVNVNVKASHLERLLAQYEEESKMDPLQVDSRSDLARMAKFIKPRVPSSIRLKQERHKMKALSNYEITKIPSTQIMAPEATLGPDTLDKLLNQLKKCEVGRSKSKEHQSSQPPKETQQTNEQQPTSSKSKLYSYQDIQDQWKKSQTNCIHPKNSSISSLNTQFEEREGKLPSSSAENSRSFMAANRTPPLDDNCALELHRSKSYIVNLIDRALSKELGTIPCERYRQKQSENMSTKRAIDLVNRHCSSNDKDLTIEFAPGMKDSSTTNAIRGLKCSASCSSKSCSCQDEPTYIKQLRQLRWGHLKHIQREVKRLEDLERFLDECSQENEE